MTYKVSNHLLVYTFVNDYIIKLKCFQELKVIRNCAMTARNCTNASSGNQSKKIELEFELSFEDLIDPFIITQFCEYKFH